MVPLRCRLGSGGRRSSGGGGGGNITYTRPAVLPSPIWGVTASPNDFLERARRCKQKFPDPKARALFPEDADPVASWQARCSHHSHRRPSPRAPRPWARRRSQ